MTDVSEAFSMIDIHRKGYLTKEDLQLVFGPEVPRQDDARAHCGGEERRDR